MVGVKDLNRRSQEILRGLVETYLETGEPVGSRFLSQKAKLDLSAASIRNVMSDLEGLGLIFAPHTSAGRMPTEAGLRMFVDGLLEVGTLSEEERQAIEAQVAGLDRSLEDVLEEASRMLSGLSQCAGLVLAPKLDARLKHVEFVAMDGAQALVVIVTESGEVENRLIDMPMGLPPSALQEASNYLNSRLRGKTLEEARAVFDREVDTLKIELDELTARVVEAGLATWTGSRGTGSRGTGSRGLGGRNAGEDLNQSLIVRGQARLLDDVTAMEDLERIRLLFDEMENKRSLVQLLGLAGHAEGVRIFIGSENKLFSLSGSSLVVSPYMDAQQRVVGVLGVIGPTRLNYARIIPMVDYTAKVVGRILG